MDKTFIDRYVESLKMECTDVIDAIRNRFTDDVENGIPKPENLDETIEFTKDDIIAILNEYTKSLSNGEKETFLREIKEEYFQRDIVRGKGVSLDELDVVKESKRTPDTPSTPAPDVPTSNGPTPNPRGIDDGDTGSDSDSGSSEGEPEEPIEDFGPDFGPEYIAYYKETQLKEEELEQLKEEYNKYKVLKDRIKNCKNTTELDTIKQEIDNENTYSDVIKNTLNILIQKKRDILQKINTGMDNHTAYDDLLAKLEANPTDENLIKAKAAYDMCKNLIENSLNGKTTYDKDTIKAYIDSNTNLTDDLKEELNGMLEITFKTSIDYDDISRQAEEPINNSIGEKETEINERKDILNLYARIIERIKKIVNNKSSFDKSSEDGKKDIAYIVNNVSNENLPENLKNELLGVIDKFLIKDSDILLEEADFGSVDFNTKVTEITDLDLDAKKITPKTNLDKISTKNPAYLEYLEEYKKLVEDKKTLEDYKLKFEQLRDKIIASTNDEQLEECKTEIDTLSSDENYPKELINGLNTIYNDKKNKLGKNNTEFDVKGPEYDKINSKSTKTPDEVTYLSQYNKILEDLKRRYLAGEDLESQKPIIEFLVVQNKLSEDLKKELFDKIDKVKTNNNNINIDDSELIKPFTDKIESLENEITARKGNIDVYNNVINMINELKQKIEAGKDVNSDEIKNDVTSIDNTINTITEEKLRNELKDKLDKTLNPPTQIIDKQSRKDLLIKWGIRIGSLVAGGIAGYLITNPIAFGITGLTLSVGNMISRHMVKRNEKQLTEKQNEIAGIEKPSPELIEEINKLKQSRKWWSRAADGLTWGTAGLFAGHMIKGIVDLKHPAKQPDPVPPKKPDPVPDPTPDPYSDIRIGNNVNDYNVSVGHDTANWAIHGTNTETLLPQYVNGDSVYKQFAILNPDGSVAQIVNSNGVSIGDLVANGVDVNRIGISVAKNGIDQAWVSAAELVQGTGRTL